jgi:hypothetical protein
MNRDTESLFHVVKPTSINWRSYGGASLRFDGVCPDSLVASGLLSHDQMPTLSCRSFRKGRGYRVGRCKDGSVNAWFDADYVLTRDTAFKRFFGALLADSRLSLVRGERS